MKATGELKASSYTHPYVPSPAPAPVDVEPVSGEEVALAGGGAPAAVLLLVLPAMLLGIHVLWRNNLSPAFF